MKSETVLITGASSGIGKELARQFAKHGHSLVICAPVEAELASVADELESEFNAKVSIYAADLTEEGAADQIFSELSAAGMAIDILVNNAGLGQRGNFWETPIEKDLEIVRLNVEAVLKLTKRFLPPMLERGSGRILNTASIAGFQPGPLMAVYHASKAFVLSFSESLATELQDKGITVTALCPGPVDTDFFPKADMVDTKIFQKGNVMSPQEVAETAYEALVRGERVIVPGAMNKAMAFSTRVMPESAQAKVNEAYYSEVEPKDHKRDPGDVAEKASEKETSRRV